MTMNRSFYLPLSAFVFPEIAGAEAVFPTEGDVAGVFIGRSSYPTCTTGSIPANPSEKALILYSAPVTWEYRDGPVMDYPFMIEIPGAWVAESLLEELKLPSLPEGVSAWAYSKAIFFRHDASLRYLFRTEAEMRQRIDSLLTFTEIKDLQYLKSICSSFEQMGLTVACLPDVVREEICQAVSALEIRTSRYDEDLLEETRCGACLGYVIAQAHKMPATSARMEDAVKLLSSGEKEGQARALVQDILGKLSQFTQLLSDSLGVAYSAQPIMVRGSFKFEGRDCLKVWEQMDPHIRGCIDFIARYPRSCWNWYGDEERFVFVRELWNQFLRPALCDRPQEVVDAFRDEVLQICRHFKNPNSTEFSFESVRSPLLQAICFALECPRESEKQNLYLKSARNPDCCLSIFGALRGYSYFSRTMFPGYANPSPIGDIVTPIQTPQPKPEVKPQDKGTDSHPELPTWASKIRDVIEKVLSACKTKKKSAADLRNTFNLAAQECSSEAELLKALSKKKGWGPRSGVYKELKQRLSAEVSDQRPVKEEDLFEKAASRSGLAEVESTDEPFIADQKLFGCLEYFLLRTLAMGKTQVDKMLADARYLQRGYAPGGRYAADPVNNPRDNAMTIRHYVNLVTKNHHLSEDAKVAISRFLTERYK